MRSPRENERGGRRAEGRGEPHKGVAWGRLGFKDQKSIMQDQQRWHSRYKSSCHRIQGEATKNSSFVGDMACLELKSLLFKVLLFSHLSVLTFFLFLFSPSAHQCLCLQVAKEAATFEFI